MPQLKGGCEWPGYTKTKQLLSVSSSGYFHCCPWAHGPSQYRPLKSEARLFSMVEWLPDAEEIAHGRSAFCRWIIENRHLLDGHTERFLSGNRVVVARVNSTLC